MTSSSIFLTLFIFFVKFSFWSRFHVNIITVSGVMTISFYKGLTRNPEIGNTPVWVLLNIWRLGRARNTKCATNIFNKMLLNAAKCQGYSFYVFWVIKGKPTGGRGGKFTPPPPTQIRLKAFDWRAYVLSLARISLWFRVSKAFERSIKVAPTFILQFKSPFHFSVIISHKYYAPFRKPMKMLQSLSFIKSLTW